MWNAWIRRRLRFVNCSKRIFSIARYLLIWDICRFALDLLVVKIIGVIRKTIRQKQKHSPVAHTFGNGLECWKEGDLFGLFETSYIPKCPWYKCGHVHIKLCRTVSIRKQGDMMEKSSFSGRNQTKSCCVSVQLERGFSVHSFPESILHASLHHSPAYMYRWFEVC